MVRNHRRSKTTKTAQGAKTGTSFPAPSASKVGLLVTDELEKALIQCRDTVRRIAKDCRGKNRKFRDIEFDLDNDANLCLNGLYGLARQATFGVSRVTDIYTQPRFFIDGAGSNDIVQGKLGDCWLLSALATASVSISVNLIEKFCVERDEKVGVYGFVFFKNGHWVTVIIDDLLFVNVPKFEELSPNEQQLFHNDKNKYNKTARKGGKNLLFARSGTENETWVPLVEKAFAKLHGDYSALDGGRAGEALEDLTGGVSSVLLTKDILDTDKFWKEELLRANVDRLFSAGFAELDTMRNGNQSVQVQGLIGGHAYSILKAVEVAGKRFLIMRNPWGASEWKGPWSDGSKEWTQQWLARLPEIGHVFGDDGQFIMEYSDFLDQFEQIDKTILFDSTWKMSMEWLRVPVRPPPAAWSFGSVSFNFSVAAKTRAVIVLSKLDERYFKGIEGNYDWNLQFLVYKVGEKETDLVAESEQAVWCMRSVNTEADLDPGNYAVQVRLDGLENSPPEDEPDPSTFDQRKLARALTQRSQARSVASNYKSLEDTDNFPIPLDFLIDREKTIVDARKKAAVEVEAASSFAPIVGDVPEDIADDEDEPEKHADGENNEIDDEDNGPGSEKLDKRKDKKKDEKVKLDVGSKKSSSDSSSSSSPDDSSGSEDEDDSDYAPNAESGDADSSDSGNSEQVDVFLGLRVYTQGGDHVSIIWTIEEEADMLYAAAVLDAPFPRECLL